jgi:hypothetical protein
MQKQNKKPVRQNSLHRPVILCSNHALRCNRSPLLNSQGGKHACIETLLLTTGCAAARRGARKAVGGGGSGGGVMNGVSTSDRLLPDPFLH